MPGTQFVADEVAFVLTDIEHAGDILSHLPPHVWPVVVDHRTGGIDQIARAVTAFPRLRAIHLFCHGEPGSLRLGQQVLGAGNLHLHGPALDAIGVALRGGDLLLYACAVAQGAAGAEFTRGLSRVLGAGVAASTKLVGEARLGGSWELDQMQGEPVTEALAFTAFRGVLAVNGSVSLTGLQEVGQTVTAVITDSNGFNPANVTYNWYRVTSSPAAETLVPSLSGTGDAFKSALLDPSMEGWSLKLYVSYTDNSSPTGSVEAPAAANVWYVGHQQIFMDHKSITMDEDGSSASTSTPVTVTLDENYLSSREYGYTSSQIKYVIRQLPTHGVLQFNGAAIVVNAPPVTGTIFTQDDVDQGRLTYTPNANYNGPDTFKFNVYDGVWSHNDDQTFNFTINKVNDTHTGDAAVTVLAVQGDTIYATRGDIADIDGFSAATPLSYRWQISDDGTSGWADISGATADHYDLGIPEASKFLRAIVTYTDGQGHTNESTSNVTDRVIPNTPPTLDTNGGITATEDTQIRITASELAVSDVEQAKPRLVYSLTSLPGHGTLTVNGVAITGTGVAFTQADIENSTPGMGVRYMPSSNYHGGDSFAFTVSDGSGGSIGSTTFSITVNNVDDAPGGTLSFTGRVSEGYTLTASSSITDADDISAAGISYAWQVQDGSGVWNTVGTAGSLLLDHAYAGHALRLQANYVDGTGHAETVTTGGGIVNTTPTLTNTGLTVNEDTGIRITSSELALADPEQGASARVFTLTSLPLHGTLTLNGTPVTALPATFTQADIDNAAPGMGLRYQAASDYNGNDRIVFTATDGAGGNIGSTQFDISVNAVNDTPTVSIVGLSLNEDDGATEITSAMLDASDVDDAAGTLVYTIESGPSKGTLSMAAGASFTKADIAAHLLTYRPNADANLSDSFQFSVKDTHGAILEHQTFTISINPQDDTPAGGASYTGTASVGETLTAANNLSDVDGMPAPGIAYEWQVKDGLGVWNAVGSGNTLLLDPSYGHHELRLKASFTDGGGKLEVSYSAVELVNSLPTMSNNGLTVLEDTSGARITAAELSLSDLEQSGTQLVYTLTGLPGHGTLTLDGVAITLPHSFTQQDIENTAPGMGLRYTPTGNYFGTDGFTFTVSDGAGGTLGSQTFHIDVNNVDDAPGGTVSFTGTVSEGETLTVHNTLTDDDGMPAPGVSYEWQVKDGSGVWNTVGTSTTLLLDHSYAGHDLRLKANYTDGASHAESVNSAVQVVNSNPAVSNNGITLAEDSTAVRITPSELAAADPEQGAALRLFTLGALSLHGKLYINGVEVTSTAQTFTQQDIENTAPGMGLRYTPNGNYFGTDSFTFTVTDGAGGMSGSQTFHIDVNNVDDAPGGTVSFTGTVSEGETLTAHNTLTDDDGMPAPGVSYQWQVKDGAGVWNTVGTSTTLLLDHSYAGHDLRLKANYADGASHAESVNSVVQVVNSNPAVSNNGITLAEDSTAVRITPSELAASDPEQGAALRQFTLGALPLHGKLYINGVEVTSTAQTFTQQDIENTALGMGLRYTPTGNYFGTDSFTFTVTDGAGGTSGSQTFHIDVNNVDDAPGGTVSFTGTVSEGETLTAHNTLTDDDGMPAPGVSYQWQVKDGAGVWNTVGTSTTLLLDHSYAGHDLRLKANYADGASHAESVNSVVQVVNSNPAVSNNGITLVEDSTAVRITPSELAASDPEQGAALRLFTLGALPLHGKLYINGVEVTSTAQTFTQQDIENTGPGMGLRYTPVANYHGADSFSFVASDGAGGVLPGATFNITVSSVDDQPGGTVTVSGAFSEGETLTVSNTLTDVEGMGAVSYEWQSKDSLGVWNAVGSGTSLTLASAYAGHELRVQASYTDGEAHADSYVTTGVYVNTKPLLVANAGLSIAEDAAVQITPAELSVRDDDQAPAQRVYTIDTLPAHGTLTVNGVALTSTSHTFTQQDIENTAPGMGVRYIPYANYYGNDLFQFSVADGAGGTIAGTDFAIVVSEVNDLPGGAVNIGSSPMVGQAMAASNTLTDAEGLGAFNYEWQASADGLSGWTAITGAMAATFTPVGASLNSFLRVKVGYTDGRGTAETVYSNVSGRVVPVPESQPADGDLDGISRDVESRVPAPRGSVQGDGNGDGFQDAEQSYVTSLLWTENGLQPSSYVTFTNMLKLDQIAAQTLVTPAALPIDLKLPVGQVTASIMGVEAGHALTMVTYISSDIAATGYWMQNRAGQWVDVSGNMATADGRTRIVFTITDGGEFDADGKVDGRITEIGGPGKWNLDHDGDGIPNQVEGSVGKGVDLRDNFVFERSDLFVMQTYRDTFSREIDSGTKDLLQGRLDHRTATEADVAKALIDQQLEMLGDLPSLYIAVFGKPADKAAFDGWNVDLHGGQNASQIAQKLFSSDSFGGLQGAPADDTTFVTQLYVNVFDRKPDHSGQDFWLGQLQGGASRDTVLHDMLDSTEFHSQHDAAIAVTALYADLLDRAPDAAGMAFWTAKYQEGAAGVDIVGAFLNSAEYHSRFY
jgi:hypothetical protein